MVTQNDVMYRERSFYCSCEKKTIFPAHNSDIVPITLCKSCRKPIKPYKNANI